MTGGGRREQVRRPDWCRSHVDSVYSVSPFSSSHSCVRKVLVVQGRTLKMFAAFHSFPCYLLIFHSLCTFFNWRFVVLQWL